MVVSMDDLPLRDSRKILVQVGTIARPYGWKTRERQFTKAILLDPNGRAIRDIPSRRNNHAFTVELPAKTMYAVLR